MKISGQLCSATVLAQQAIGDAHIGTVLSDTHPLIRAFCNSFSCQENSHIK